MSVNEPRNNFLLELLAKLQFLCSCDSSALPDHQTQEEVAEGRDADVNVVAEDHWKNINGDGPAAISCSSGTTRNTDNAEDEAPPVVSDAEAKEQMQKNSLRDDINGASSEPDVHVLMSSECSDSSVAQQLQQERVRSFAFFLGVTGPVKFLNIAGDELLTLGHDQVAQRIYDAKEFSEKILLEQFRENSLHESGKSDDSHVLLDEYKSILEEHSITSMQHPTPKQAEASFQSSDAQGVQSQSECELHAKTQGERSARLYCQVMEVQVQTLDADKRMLRSLANCLNALPDELQVVKRCMLQTSKNNFDFMQEFIRAEKIRKRIAIAARKSEYYSCNAGTAPRTNGDAVLGETDMPFETEWRECSEEAQQMRDRITNLGEHLYLSGREVYGNVLSAISQSVVGSDALVQPALLQVFLDTTGNYQVFIDGESAGLLSNLKQCDVGAAWAYDFWWHTNACASGTDLVMGPHELQGGAYWTTENGSSFRLLISGEVEVDRSSTDILRSSLNILSRLLRLATAPTRLVRAQLALTENKYRDPVPEADLDIMDSALQALKTNFPRGFVLAPYLAAGENDLTCILVEDEKDAGRDADQNARFASERDEGHDAGFGMDDINQEVPPDFSDEEAGEEEDSLLLESESCGGKRTKSTASGSFDDLFTNRVKEQLYTVILNGNHLDAAHLELPDMKFGIEK
ncbi:unnamed protein product [Amoebophrya sp. A120]|nr:unnamed protein product [Amoebophrya sp. A120]|eukprot:GSA120T00003980001.1